MISRSGLGTFSPGDGGVFMAATRAGLARMSCMSAKDIELRLVTEGRFQELPEACRAGLKRLADDAHCQSACGAR